MTDKEREIFLFGHELAEGENPPPPIPLVILIMQLARLFSWLKQKWEKK